MNRELKFSESIKIYSSKETVWKTLLSAEFYQISWGASLSTTWQTGSPVQFTGSWEDVAYLDKGVIKAYIENSYLEFSYWSSFWEAKDVPEEYCNISYAVKQLDEHSSEFTITQVGFRDKVHYDDTVELWKNTSKILKSQSEKDELVSINNKVFNSLISKVTSFAEETYNRELPNKWNAALLVEHIIMGNAGMKQFLTEVTYASDTPYDLNIEAIRNLMLNNEVKHQSPDFLIPAIKIYDIKEQKEMLLNIQAELNDCILTLDFDKKCGTAEMPPFGYLSIYEWLNFSLFHILRHTTQLMKYEN